MKILNNSLIFASVVILLTACGAPAPFDPINGDDPKGDSGQPAASLSEIITA